MIHRPAIVLAAVIMVGSLSLSRAAGEPKLLDETGSGIVPVATETRLVVHAVSGRVFIQPGDPGEIRFQSTSPEKPDDEIPVALWTDGGAFRFEPPRGQASVRASLRVWVPAGMSVRLDLEDAAVGASGLDNELSVHGRRIRVDAPGLLRPAEFDIEGGAVKLEGSAKGVTIGGRELDVALEAIGGQARLRLSGGTVRLTGLLADLDGEFSGSGVTVDSVAGSVNLTFHGGKAQLSQLPLGGEVALSGTPLELSQIRGELSVVTDAAVHFSDCRSTLHIESAGAPVTGTKNDGLLEVKTSNAEVTLERIQGQLRVGGNDLVVKLADIDAELGVFTRSSTVTVERAANGVSVENDRGDVTITRAAEEVSVRSEGGEVRLLEMNGAVNVDANGPQVEVGWSSIGGDKNSRIKNDGGDVTVRFPGAGGCHVDAKSKFGRIDSNLPKFTLEGGGGSAQGVVGSGGPKTVTIEASGDVHLIGPGGSTRTGEAPPGRRD